MPTQEIQVALSLPPFIKLSGKWVVQKAEKDAAWELYVELVTRISTVPLDEDSGLLREALTSLHSIFDTTRGILRRHGRAVATRQKNSLSFGVLAVTVLNSGIRPFLAKWHPALEDYEATREEGVSRMAHERSWERSQDMRKELAGLREILVQYAKILEDALSLDGDISLLWDGGTTS